MVQALAFDLGVLICEVRWSREAASAALRATAFKIQSRCRGTRMCGMCVEISQLVYWR